MSLHDASPAAAVATVGLALLVRGAGGDPTREAALSMNSNQTGLACACIGVARDRAPQYRRCRRIDADATERGAAGDLGVRREAIHRCVVAEVWYWASAAHGPYWRAACLRDPRRARVPPAARVWGEAAGSVSLFALKRGPDAPPPRAGTRSRARSADFGLSIIWRTPASVVRCAHRGYRHEAGCSAYLRYLVCPCPGVS